MSFEAEMIVPAGGHDDLGSRAEASITFLRYSLEIGYREEDPTDSRGGLEILKEELEQINKGEADAELLFEHKRSWLKSVVLGSGRRGSPFISTDGEGADRLIRRHQEGKSGRPLNFRAADLPRTVISVANAAESPTALLARREMQSWRLLQLEPTALRQPDAFTAPQRLGPDGSHLPATLYRLARTSRSSEQNGHNGKPDEERIYAQVANRLSELIADVRQVSIDRDERRALLTLTVTGQDGTAHTARALSDGTLRFLALSILELDPEADRVLCLEEPENGVHPDRVPAILRLLKDISTDTNEPVNDSNPLRQVIINTHSPQVVSLVPDDALLVAEAQEYHADGQRSQRVRFSCLRDTWRAGAEEKPPQTVRGSLAAYLSPIKSGYEDNARMQKASGQRTVVRRVIDHPDLQILLPLSNVNE